MVRQILSSWVGIGAIAGMFTATLVSACSADGRGHSFDTDDGAGAGQSTNSGVGGGFTTSTGIGGGVGVGTGSGVGGGCASSSVKAELIPLDMFIMFDQSGSMSDPAGNGTKWDAATGAMKAFVSQPGTDGIGVGIQFFGLSSGGGACPASCMTDPDCGACGPCIPFPIPGFPGICAGASGGDSCNAADYSKAEVEIAPLPGVAPAIINALNGHSPSTGTPTHPALDGAIQHAQAWNQQNLDHVVIVVFVTDGDPQSCDTDLNNINALAASGKANGILTYVIGVGNSLVALNGIAAAGGTGQAFLVDANANANQEFLDAMNAIRGTALACSYKIPVPATGMPDYESVNVQYTPSDGSMPVIFPKVIDKSSCPAGGDGWYYDNNKTPTQIVLCDSTCSKVKMDEKGQVDIVLGCASILN